MPIPIIRQLSLFFDEDMEIEEIPTTGSKEKLTKKKSDIHNLRLLSGLRMDRISDMPLVKPWNPDHISEPLAFHEARALYRKRKTLKGYFVHFYTEESRYECLRKCPERYLNMLKTADFVIGPDFSTYRNWPCPVVMKNAFDNMLLAAWLQKNGVKVVANVFWITPLTYNLVFSGQPSGGTIAVGSCALSLSDRKGVSLWLHGYREAVHTLHPTNVIRYGKSVPEEKDIYPNPIMIENPYIKNMRYGR